MREFENERPFWDDDSWIQTQFYYYFFDPNSRAGNGLLDKPAHLDDLRTNFTHAQAYAISRAAVQSLEGDLGRYGDGVAVFYMGNASQVMGSPYIGLDDRYNPRFTISAKGIQKYLDDVVISTIYLKTSTHKGEIQALKGGQVYLWSGKMPFFFGYGSCLVATIGVYVMAWLDLKANGRLVASGLDLMKDTSPRKQLPEIWGKPGTA
ncbi:uncharacterized protein DNG_09134 [Cephalotrichum gorgonifer]|uniref:Uncharacterized protein n=1 Tax=Cephalotrichum gorgonifer TaxID=2041049 RepID=A0AAE8N6C0_9PEZI|nr:uncharacterized protein DNG_09134 [Cephalotrichum gorgonifer]